MKILLFSPSYSKDKSTIKLCCFGVQVFNSVYGIVIDLDWEKDR